MSGETVICQLTTANFGGDGYLHEPEFCYTRQVAQELRLRDYWRLPNDQQCLLRNMRGWPAEPLSEEELAEMAAIGC